MKSDRKHRKRLESKRRRGKSNTSITNETSNAATISTGLIEVLDKRPRRMDENEPRRNSQKPSR